MGGYQMNPQRAQHMQPLVQTGPGSAIEQGDGTQASGYVTPDLGPFECENCQHFQPENPEYPKNCDHPKVVADQDVDRVDPEGCCNFFKSAHNESQAEEHGEQNGVSDEQTA